MRRPTFFARRWIPVFLLCTAGLVVTAQDDELPPDEVQDLVDRYVERGTKSLLEGNYDEARLRFRSALRRDPANREAWTGVASCDRAQGKYEAARKALETLLQKHPGDRNALVRMGQLHLLRGNDASARNAADKVLKTTPEGLDLPGLEARVLKAESLMVSGQRGDARDALEYFLDYYDKRFARLNAAATGARRLRANPAKGRPLAREMTTIAKALRLYVQLSPLDHDFAQSAKDLCEIAREVDPKNWEALVEYVRVRRFERESAIAHARKALELADRVNPEIADLYTEVATTLRTAYGNDGEARRHAESALVINPSQTEARALLAQLFMEDDAYDKAEDHLRRGLAVHPRHRTLLSLQATLKLLRGDNDAFEAGMKAVLGIDKGFGEGFHVAGQVVASRQRRYGDAVRLIRRGLKIDPLNFDAYVTYGVFLANQGRSKEALEQLARGKKLFPYSHPVRDNFKVVLDYVIGEMTSVKTKHFVIRMDPSEKAVLGRFLPDLLEECWEDMVKRYDFTPRTPVLVEVFKKADDFSVRTLGLPGIPALGACFGGLITLDSPLALPPGNFNWASTARHEFAHVITLQLSKGQVPRWFTEGVSVFEERPLDTGWGLHPRLERELFDAHATGDIPPVREFDAWFRGRRVAYAYHVAGHMVDMLRQRKGEEGIVKALELWADNVPTAQVLERAFGLTPAQFDAAFKEHVAKRMDGYKLTPRWSLVRRRLEGRLVENPEDGQNLLRLAWALYQENNLIDAGGYLDKAMQRLPADHKPLLLLRMLMASQENQGKKARQLLKQYFDAGGENHTAWLMKANLARQEEDLDTYVDALKRAQKAWPLRAGPGSTYQLLYRHYKEQEDQKAALAQLEEAVRISPRDIVGRVRLAKEYAAAGRDAEAAAVLEQALRITVYHEGVHAALVPLYKKLKKIKKAIRSASIRAEMLQREIEKEESTVQEVRVARAWLDLAELLLEDGNREAAAAALEKARAIDSDEVSERLKALQEKLKGS